MCDSGVGISPDMYEDSADSDLPIDRVWGEARCPSCKAKNWFVLITGQEILEDIEPTAEACVCWNCQNKWLIDEEYSKEIHGDWPLDKLIEAANAKMCVKTPS
jgi:hypothetical protein